MKSGGLNCLKYLVFFFNLLIFICGIAALSVGIWALVNEESFKKIMVDSSYVLTGIYIIIAVGSALFLIGFMGCCGAIKENRCMLGTFFIIVLALFIAQLGAAIFIYVKRGDVTKAVTDSIGKYGDTTPTGKGIQEGWDTLQKTMKCCGVYNFTDWMSNADWLKRFPNKLVPDSCCVLDTDGNPSNSTYCQSGVKGYLNTNGCLNKLSKYINVVVIVAAVILVVEILAMIFSCCLYKHANDYGELA